MFLESLVALREENDAKVCSGLPCHARGHHDPTPSPLPPTSKHCSHTAGRRPCEEPRGMSLGGENAGQAAEPDAGTQYTFIVQNVDNTKKEKIEGKGYP